MSIIHRAHLAFLFSSGWISKEERQAVTIANLKSAATSAATMVTGTVGASAIGFVLPNCFLLQPWAPKELSINEFMNTDGGICLVSAAAVGFWGYSKTAPHFWHHVYMVWDPEVEIIAAFQKDIKAIFDDAMRFLVAVVSVAIPAYLITKSIQWLVI